MTTAKTLRLDLAATLRGLAETAETGDMAAVRTLADQLDCSDDSGLPKRGSPADLAGALASQLWSDAADNGVYLCGRCGQPASHSLSDDYGTKKKPQVVVGYGCEAFVAEWRGAYDRVERLGGEL